MLIEEVAGGILGKEVARMTKRILYSFILISFFFCLFATIPSLIKAAPDPAEIEKLKRDAPIQLIGTIVKDEFQKDLTEQDHYSQLRKMTISVEEWIKVPSDEKKSDMIEVVYTYIPLWKTYHSPGGRYMDISVGDVVEIWLEEREFGWEPVFGGNTVSHIVYVDNRTEPIREPLLHKLQRNLNQLWVTNSSTVVLVSLIVFVSLLFITFRIK